MIDRGLIAALRCLPRSALSRAAGRAAGAKLPGPLQRPVLRGFAAAVGVDLSEVRDPLESFPSLQSFFVRALRDGVRPVDPAPDAFVSPCDGRWGESGRIEDGRLLQVKGRHYSLAALLASADDALRFEGGSFATLYLSPRDYHRFHTPAEGHFTRRRYLPGTLWPVNGAGLAHVANLFAENERVVAEFELAANGQSMLLIPVGATIVGSIRLAFDDLATNRGAPASERRFEPAPSFAKGAEWGRFELGSTIVLVAPPGALELDRQPPGTPVRLGQRIGRIAS